MTERVQTDSDKRHAKSLASSRKRRREREQAAAAEVVSFDDWKALQTPPADPEQAQP